ncbi:hypothetical protein NBG4_640002 [Candidatus Sulfobium mesophilum]|uniref:Helix-turn-helix domain-containing protein n=1 Tax=Candidatus Sulfobium mesophilum TaxID=2016548 RepID=A0A2U3QJS9_9BACT|nr:hypothetical protein NBG4_640002 [Candidatus Sulfobium mesophilum]
MKKSATPETISEDYGIPRGTLANMRSQGRGPKFYRRGRRIVYFYADVEKWLTSDPVQTADSCRDAEVSDRGRQAQG